MEEMTSAKKELQFLEIFISVVEKNRKWNETKERLEEERLLGT